MDQVVDLQTVKTLDTQGFAKTLRRAAELIDQGWCQGTLARDESGVMVGWNTTYAVKWCEMGAFLRAQSELFGELKWDPADPPELEDLMLILRLAGFMNGLPQDDFGGPFNDAPGRTADEVATHLRAGADRLEHDYPLGL